jgi:hypothetical protein
MEFNSAFKGLKYQLLFKMGKNIKQNFLEMKLKLAKQIRSLDPKCFVKVERGCNFFVSR